MKTKIYFIVTICLLCFSQAQARTDFNINAGNVTISTNGEYKISGNGAPTTNIIKVNPGVVATITLENVNIDVSNIEVAPITHSNVIAFDMTDATVTLVLSGTNSLTSGIDAAGLQVPDGASLTITSISGDGSLDGYLKATATGYDGGAGIGGAFNSSGGHANFNCGSITILGGTISAAASRWEGGGIPGGKGAAIGGAYHGHGGIITIVGGAVNAAGGDQAAGIGGGYGGYAETITISGGTVVAIGGRDGAAIGGGYGGGGGAITLAGGTVIAVGNIGPGGGIPW